jgi:predicted RNA binding protein YcfA (HicA-like mRNA interferase family)
MPKLPPISGNEVLRLLKDIGYVTLRQKGSHVRLRKITPVGEHNITVPMHKVLAIGTLNDILNKVSLWNNTTKDALLRKL